MTDWHLVCALAAGDISGVVKSPVNNRTLVIRGKPSKPKANMLKIRLMKMPTLLVKRYLLTGLSQQYLRGI